jgi:hypothetical protein
MFHSIKVFCGFPIIPLSFWTLFQMHFIFKKNPIIAIFSLLRVQVPQEVDTYPWSIFIQSNSIYFTILLLQVTSDLLHTDYVSLPSFQCSCQCSGYISDCTAKLLLLLYHGLSVSNAHMWSLLGFHFCRGSLELACSTQLALQPIMFSTQVYL